MVARATRVDWHYTPVNWYYFIHEHAKKHDLNHLGPRAWVAFGSGKETKAGDSFMINGTITDTLPSVPHDS